MISKFLYGFIILLVYFLLAASLAMLARKLLRMPRELFRKTLHLVLLFSLPVFLYAFPTWLLSALAAISFAALASMEPGMKIPACPSLSWTVSSTGMIVPLCST